VLGLVLFIMKNIKEYGAPNSALFLIKQHTIGSLRDEADLTNAKYHALESINFTIYIFQNIEGTIEEKIQFLLKTKEEIPKFHGR